MSYNPFKLKAARKLLADAGIEVGVMARISWTFTGGGLGAGMVSSHEGPVSFYDGEWIELKPTTRSPGHLRLPIVALIDGTKIELVADNPFINKQHQQKGSTDE